MTLRQNLLAGLANSMWSALVGFAVVPVYLKYLGIEAYGLVGIFMTAQVMFQLLDMGLAPTMNREVARHSASGDLTRAGKLLHSLAVIYWSVAVVIAGTVMVIAPFIATHWLDSQSLSRDTVVHALMLMGLVVASRWPIGLYQAALLGAQRMTVSSVVNMSMVTFSAAGAIAVLALISPTIEAFFIWQACAGASYAIILRSVTWRVIGRTAENRFDVSELKRIWKFTAGMSAIGLTGVLFSQMDKIILSKVLSLEDFGHYTLAGVAVSSLFILITPVFNIIYPRFSALVAKGNISDLRSQYKMGTRMLASVLFPAATVLALFSEELVNIWTGNPDIAKSTAPLISLLAVGSALHGVMHFPYAAQLAHGATRLALTTNCTLIFFAIPLFSFLPIRFGALGGALAWLIFMMAYALLGTWLTHRHFPWNDGRSWLVREVGIPASISGIAGLLVHQCSFINSSSIYVRLAIAILLSITLPIFLAMTSRVVRQHLWDFVKHRRRTV